MEESKLVSRQTLRQDLIRLFQDLRVPPEDAAAVADVLIQAEQWGVRSHGVMRVARYARCLRQGGILPDASFRVLRRCGGWVQASAEGGLGIPASMRATDLAISLAREHGIGVVNVRKSHHNGAEGIYAHHIARQGMIGFAMSTGNPVMAVTGASETVIGNNPFSYALPAGRFAPVMLDIAMSAVADGKVQIARSLGQLLPPGCILDREGHPSQDPEDYFNGGVLLPFGAHKGFGLAVMVECLAGILSGAGMLDEIDSWNERPGQCGNTGHLIAAMDISKMMPLEHFCSRMEELILRIKSAKPAEGVEAIYYPGELEHLRARAAGETVTLLPAAVQALACAADLTGTSLQCLSRKGAKPWDDWNN